MPLVEVAWADGRLELAERRAVLEAAEASGVLPGTASHQLLEGWLAERPGPELREAWREYVVTLQATVSIEAQLHLKESVVGRARAVAGAAGGVLGVRSVSRQEELVLRELAAIFQV